MKTTTLLLILLVAVLPASDSQARLNYIWTYEELLRLSDVVILATVASTKETSERTTVEKAIYNSITPFKAVGLETVFSALTVLKGKLPEKTFVLHHYRELGPSTLGNGGPMLVGFKADKKIEYLLFLTREPDGRYAAVSGQIDPAFSIKRLQDILESSNLNHP